MVAKGHVTTVRRPTPMLRCRIAVKALDVLLLEDDANDAALLAARLKTAGVVCSLTRVYSEAQYVDAIAARTWDVILADYNIPGYDGTKALLVARAKAPDTPFVFFTGALGGSAIECSGWVRPTTSSGSTERLPASISAPSTSPREGGAPARRRVRAAAGRDRSTTPNPLNVILAREQRREDDGRHKPELARLLDRIHTSSERAARMIFDILDFTQSRSAAFRSRAGGSSSTTSSSARSTSSRSSPAASPSRMRARPPATGMTIGSRRSSRTS